MRFIDILNTIQENIISAQKTYDGKKRNDLKDSDFLFPETRSFPIVSPSDVKDAISNYGRMSSKMSYESFLRKLYNLCKRKGPEFVAALPDASKEKLGLNTQAIYDYEEEDEDDVDEYDDPEMYEIIEALKNQIKSIKMSKGADSISSIDEDLIMYKKELLDMTITSLNSIYGNMASILNNIDNPTIQNKLTEPWLQGKISVTNEFIKSIHDFLKFSSDTDDMTTIGKKLPGLWENIRKKKERMGKNYKPAKPGDKDRPDSETWKKLTK